ncbi:hypothetical protein V6Z12_A08G226300 [Gossypium hirsutum]
MSLYSPFTVHSPNQNLAQIQDKNLNHNRPKTQITNPFTDKPRPKLHRPKKARNISRAETLGLTPRAAAFNRRTASTPLVPPRQQPSYASTASYTRQRASVPAKKQTKPHNSKYEKRNLYFDFDLFLNLSYSVSDIKPKFWLIVFFTHIYVHREYTYIQKE